jgi:hypothetical protein
MISYILPHSSTKVKRKELQSGKKISRLAMQTGEWG